LRFLVENDEGFRDEDVEAYESSMVVEEQVAPDEPNRPETTEEIIIY
jgi:hypothetical protein